MTIEQQHQQDFQYMTIEQQHQQDLEYWQKKFNDAELFMSERMYNNNKTALIEVSPQYPLVDGIYPNAEYEARLECAFKLYIKLLSDGFYAEIFVPGSKHMYNGVAGKISLSEAGKNYLVSKGVDPSFIRGEDAIDYYMKGCGCYNSADECKIGADLFKEGDFSQIHFVIEPSQMIPYSLLFAEFGISPQFHTDVSYGKFHNPLNEMNWMQSELLSGDFCEHNWQGKNSNIAINSRLERNAEYLNKTAHDVAKDLEVLDDPNYVSKTESPMSRENMKNRLMRFFEIYGLSYIPEQAEQYTIDEMLDNLIDPKEVQNQTIDDNSNISNKPTQPQQFGE